MTAKKAAFSLFAALLFWFAVELFLALTGLSRSPSEELYSDIYDPAYEMIHGVHFPLGNQPNQEWQVNRFGFRGPEINREKAEGVCRIFCVGDSSTAGHFLPYEQTYSARLGPMLTGRLTGCRRVEVINAGIPGTAITQQNYTIAKKLMDFTPDMIVLYAVPSMSQEILALRQIQQQLAGQPFALTDRIRQVFRRFHLYRALRRLIKGDAKAELASHMEIVKQSIDSGAGAEARRLALYGEDLQQFAHLCREHGVTPVLVQHVVGTVVKKLAHGQAMPGSKEYAEYFRSPEAEYIQKAMTFAKERKIVFVNPYDRFVPESLKGPLFFEDQVHPNRRGHELLAQGIGEAILNIK